MFRSDVVAPKPTRSIMKRIAGFLIPSLFALLILCHAGDAAAQSNQQGGRQRQGNNQGGRQRQGNSDPAQAQQRLLERYRQNLEVTDDAEWKALEPLVQKVVEARTALGGNRMGFARGNRPTGDANPPDQTQRRVTTPPNSAADQLQKLIDAKASAAEIKPALSKYLEYRKSKQAELDRAQAALRAVLTSRQEAIAALLGLL